MSTYDAARVLRVSAQQLQYLIVRGRIPPPAKNRSGAYRWSLADLERARSALPHVKAGRPAVREVEHAVS
jgi:DNA-binding transcriptional MerR regulator